VRFHTEASGCFLKGLACKVDLIGGGTVQSW
jgi:hypothetical protein